MPGNRGVGRRGLQTANYGGGAKLQGETAVEGDLPGVREELGKGVTGGAPPNLAWIGKRGVGVGGRRGRQVQ